MVQTLCNTPRVNIKPRYEVTDMSAPLSTADLPASLYVDPVAFQRVRAAIAAGLTLAVSACRCAPQRGNCPTCLVAVVRGLPA